MNCKNGDPVAPAYGGYPMDPAYDRYIKKCLKKNPYLYKMIDYIVDCKIAALRAEMCQMWAYRPSTCYPSAYPGMTYPNMMYPGMMGPANIQPGSMPPILPSVPGYPQL